MIYDEIYKRYYQVLVNYIYIRIKDEFYSQELASETFKLLWVRWATSDFQYENAVLKWLYHTADFKIKAYTRDKNNDYIPLDSEYVQNMADIQSALDCEELDLAQEDEKYHGYMSDVRKQLPQKDIEFFNMIVIQKLPYNQIALELNTTVAAVKMRWLRLKIRLRKIVRDIIGEEK